MANDEDIIMERIQEIKDKMDQIQLKKVLFGGYSKEDVQSKLDMMFAMFENAMKKQIEKETELLAGFEKQIMDLRDEYESRKRLSDILINDLNRSISELTARKQAMEQDQQRMQEENDILTAKNEQILQDQINMKEAYKDYCKELLKEYSESLHALSCEFSRILENVSNMQKEVDEERIFEGLENAFEMKKREMLVGTVTDCEELNV